MAEAMKTREKCLTAIAKWQENLAKAEDLIQQLRESDVADAADDPDTRLATAVDNWKTQQEQAAVVIDPSI
jgi:hypothetical protein